MSSAHHESTAKGPDGRMVDRMLFFSDAVFAIVLTIMVLELHAPLMEAKGAAQTQSAAALWDALAGMGRTFFAYFLSFAIVGFWWTIHMRVTRSLHRFDWPAAVANLAFILTATLIPFAASLLGENMANTAAWAVYWGVNAATSFALTLLMLVSTRDGGRLVGGISGRQRLGRVIQSVSPGLCFSAGVWLAVEGNIDLSRACWVLIPPMMIVARVVAGRTHPPAVDAEA
jgi:uncharacterized membrane protein